MTDEASQSSSGDDCSKKEPEATFWDALQGMLILGGLTAAKLLVLLGFLWLVEKVYHWIF